MSLLNKIEGYCLNEIKQIGSTKPIDEKNKARVEIAEAILAMIQESREWEPLFKKIVSNKNLFIMGK